MRRPLLARVKLKMKENQSHAVRSQLVMVLLSLVLGAGAAFAQQPANAGSVTISAIENEHTHELALAVVREAYRRIGYNAEFDFLPGRRALAWAGSGITDGDLARIAGTEKKFPNLIRISTPVVRFTGVTFTIKTTKDIRSWEDLRGLRIGVIRGIRYSEIGTMGMDRIFARDMTQLFRLLMAGRIDVAVATLDAGRIEMHRNFRETGIHVIGEPLHVSPLFHFVHAKNKALVPELEAVLREMEAGGEIDSLREKQLAGKLTQ